MYVFIQIIVITKNVITNSNNIVDNMLKTFAQEFPVVVQYKKSVFDRVLLKASQCYQKCHCFNGVNIFFKKCNILAHFLLSCILNTT